MVAVADRAPVAVSEDVPLGALLDADAADHTDLTDDEVIERLLAAHRLRARVDAAVVALTGAFDARTLGAADGARSTPSWVTARVGVGFGHAKTDLALARDLRAHRTIADAARDGRLTRDQVRALLQARAPGLEQCFDLCQEVLVDEVATTTLAAGRRYLARWAREVRERFGIPDPDGPAPDGGRGRSRAHLSPVGDRWAGDLDLSAVDGEMVANAIDHQIDELWRTGAFHTDDGLEAAERRATALVEVIERGTRGGDADSTARPLILALSTPGVLTRHPGHAAGRTAAADDAPGPVYPFPTVLSELSRSGPIHPHVIARLACEGDTIPVSIGPGTDQLTMGRTIRIANRTQRRALRIRDGGCQFPGCSVPPEHCIAHHITPWENGGPTDLANLVLLCRFHHRAVHGGGFTIGRDPDGTITTHRTDGRPFRAILRPRTPLVGPRPPPHPGPLSADETPDQRREAHHLARARITDLIRHAQVTRGLADARRARTRDPSATTTLGQQSGGATALPRTAWSCPVRVDT